MCAYSSHAEAIPVDDSRTRALFTEGAPKVEDEARIPDLHSIGFSALIQQLSPAVVNISVEGKRETDEQEPPRPNHPFFRRDPGGQLRSLGSGFIISPEGYILTNNHVVEGASRIVVRLLEDRTEYEAKVIGVDPKTDICLLKIDTPQELPIAFLGDAESVEVGDWVLAIGNQFQLGQTVTAGIVSAKSRRVPVGMTGPFDAFIQTDASINPGSSGGPLFNTRGQVIGVNTAIFSPGGRGSSGSPGFNIGIGFAIPINVIKSVLPQLRSEGKVVRGMLGVKIQAVNADIATALTLPTLDGALVSEILPNSPAGKAGVKQKDVIVRFGDVLVRDFDDLPMMVASTPVGTKLKLEIIRNAARVNLTVHIDEYKDGDKTADETPEPQVNSLGMALQALTAEQASVLKIPGTRGLVVVKIEQGSLAEGAGFAVGDIIEEFAGTKVESVDDMTKLIDDVRPGRPVLSVVRKPDGVRILVIKIR